MLSRFVVCVPSTSQFYVSPHYTQPAWPCTRTSFCKPEASAFLLLDHGTSRLILLSGRRRCPILRSSWFRPSPYGTGHPYLEARLHTAKPSRSMQGSRIYLQLHGGHSVSISPCGAG